MGDVSGKHDLMTLNISPEFWVGILDFTKGEETSNTITSSISSIVVSVTYILVIFDVDISSMINKALHNVMFAIHSCHK